MLIDALPRILFAVGILVVALVVGNIAPMLAIGDNIDGFTGYQQTQARTAWQAARSVIGGSLEPLAIRAIRVEEIMDEAPQARNAAEKFLVGRIVTFRGDGSPE